MFNFRSTEDCDQEKEDDLFKEFTELNNDDLDLENLIEKDINLKANNQNELNNESEEEESEDELNDKVNNHNLKTNHQDDDYQYLSNEQIILNSKVSFA